jgi:hypothetical protein
MREMLSTLIRMGFIDGLGERLSPVIRFFDYAFRIELQRGDGVESAV